jgi:hypothetical protein
MMPKLYRYSHWLEVDCSFSKEFNRSVRDRYGNDGAEFDRGHKRWLLYPYEQSWSDAPRDYVDMDGEVAEVKSLLMQCFGMAQVIDARPRGVDPQDTIGRVE